MRNPTIYDALKTKLGRHPTVQEVKEEVTRIIDEAKYERTQKRKSK